MDKFYIVRNPAPIGGSMEHFFVEPNPDYASDEERLHSICFGLDEGGMDHFQLARVMFGTGQNTWYAEDSVLYADETAARKDAEKRLAKMRKAYEKQKGKTPKKASVAERVVERFRDNYR